MHCARFNDCFNYLVDAGASYDAEDYAASYNGYMAAFDFKKNELLGNAAQLDTGLLFNAGIIAGGGVRRLVLIHFAPVWT